MVPSPNELLTDTTPLDGSITDGRRQRGERNREAVIDAILDLITEGNERPTTNEIADRSGVSVRSVFRHFDDVESLYSEAVDRHQTRMLPLWRLDTGSGPLPDRIDALVAQRARLNEATGSVRRVAERLRRTSPAIDTRLEFGRSHLVAQLQQLFEPELALLDVRERQTLLDALEVATSWFAWVAMRESQGCTVEQAAASMDRTVRALLDA